MSLLEIDNLYTKTTDEEQKNILKGLNLKVNKGEVHVIMGPNGAGKSTLANTILNNSRYSVTKGDILFENKSIMNLKTNERANLGIFMSFQNAIEIPGISIANFIRSAMNSKGDKTNILSFAKELDKKSELLNFDKEKCHRDLNVGFSGGEKKKSEILQLLMLNPKLAILDETDSGLDVDAIKTVVKGINEFRNKDNAIIIITHSMKMINDIDVNYVHILVDGKIVKTGSKELALEIEKNGFKEYIKD